VVDAKGHRRIISYGHLNQGDNRPLDGNTVFEIGSVTKVFTSLLLAQMVVDGQVKLDDPVSRYLPSSVHVPQGNGRQIELIDLATHTSGLPGAVSNMHPKDPKNPWADYSTEEMYEFLNGYVLQRYRIDISVFERRSRFAGQRAQPEGSHRLRHSGQEENP
jgi:CubicO group peptidase (beta-lactamase class C family)